MGDVANIVGGGTPSTNNEEYWNGNIDWYSPAEIGDKTYMNGSRKKITECGFKNSSAKILPIGTVLFTSRAGIGNTAILTKEGTTNQGFQSIVPHSNLLNSYFIYSRTSELKRFGETIGAGSTFVEVSGKQMARMPMLFPVIEEQVKIGSFFERLDFIIALHQRKWELLKQLKQAYLQVLFPKEDEKSPRVRFTNFEGDWEQRKVKEICTISTGKGNTQDKVTYGKYPFYVRSEIIERSNNFLYDQEAVLTVGDGVGTGKVFHYVKGKYNLHQRVYRMYDFNNTVSARYFYYYFSEKFYRRVMTMTAKTSVDSVRMNMIADMDIKFPSEPEQKEMIVVFDNLEKAIALHQKKENALKELKKLYLQKLFV